MKFLWRSICILRETPLYIFRSDRGKSVRYRGINLPSFYFDFSIRKYAAARRGRMGGCMVVPIISISRHYSLLEGNGGERRERGRSHENGKSTCRGVIGHCLFTALKARDIAIMRNSLFRENQRRRNCANASKRLRRQRRQREIVLSVFC